MTARDDIHTHYGPGSPTLGLLLDVYDARVTAAAYRAAADELTAAANPHNERGAGVRWAADRLRARADEMEQQ